MWSKLSSAETFSSLNSNVAGVLQNRACEPDTNGPCTYNRTFTPQTDEILVSTAKNATLAVFFDISENVRDDEWRERIDGGEWTCFRAILIC